MIHVLLVAALYCGVFSVAAQHESVGSTLLDKVPHRAQIRKHQKLLSQCIEIYERLSDVDKDWADTFSVLVTASYSLSTLKASVHELNKALVAAVESGVITKDFAHDVYGCEKKLLALKRKKPTGLAVGVGVGGLAAVAALVGIIISVRAKQRAAHVGGGQHPMPQGEVVVIPQGGGMPHHDHPVVGGGLVPPVHHEGDAPVAMRGPGGLVLGNEHLVVDGVAPEAGREGETEGGAGAAAGVYDASDDLQITITAETVPEDLLKLLTEIVVCVEYDYRDLVRTISGIKQDEERYVYKYGDLIVATSAQINQIYHYVRTQPYNASIQQIIALMNASGSPEWIEKRQNGVMQVWHARDLLLEQCKKTLITCDDLSPDQITDLLAQVERDSCAREVLYWLTKPLARRGLISDKERDLVTALEPCIRRVFESPALPTATNDGVGVVSEGLRLHTELAAICLGIRVVRERLSSEQQGQALEAINTHVVMFTPHATDLDSLVADYALANLYAYSSVWDSFTEDMITACCSNPSRYTQFLEAVIVGGTLNNHSRQRRSDAVVNSFLDHINSGSDTLNAAWLKIMYQPEYIQQVIAIVDRVVRVLQSTTSVPVINAAGQYIAYVLSNSSVHENFPQMKVCFTSTIKSLCRNAVQRHQVDVKKAYAYIVWNSIHTHDSVDTVVCVRDACQEFLSRFVKFDESNTPLFIALMNRYADHCMTWLRTYWDAFSRTYSRKHVDGLLEYCNAYQNIRENNIKVSLHVHRQLP
ncbi:MAG: hypothetical protein WCJ17_01065, partial [bacterium]